MQKKYYVQYRDTYTDIWNNVDSGTDDPRQARLTLLEESKEDPNYAHRLIKVEEKVIALIEALEEE